eukprot:tig00000571_g2194.t1
MRRLGLLLALALLALAAASETQQLYTQVHACRSQCLTELGATTAPVDARKDLLHFTLSYCKKKCDKRVLDDAASGAPAGKAAVKAAQDPKMPQQGLRAAEEAHFHGKFMQVLQSIPWPPPESLEEASGAHAAMTLFSLVVATQPRVVIEVGRYSAYSTVAIAAGLQLLSGYNATSEAGVFGPPPPFPFFKVFSVDMLGADPTPYLEQAGLSSYAQLLWERPEETKQFAGVQADLIVIDGDNCYLCAKDLIAKFVGGHLKEGGYFVLHNNLNRYDDKLPDFGPIKRLNIETARKGDYDAVRLGEQGRMGFTLFRRPAPLKAPLAPYEPPTIVG